MAAAAQVIAERGFKEATVRDIGDAAGILSGSLYYHFDSKDQIVLDLLLPSLEAMEAEASALVESAANHTEALMSLIRVSVLTTAANPHKTVILRNSGRAFDEFELLAPINKLRRGTFTRWLDVITKGIASGEFSDDVDPEVMVHGILDGVLGAARWFSQPNAADAEHVIDSLTKLYVSGLSRS